MKKLKTQGKNSKLKHKTQGFGKSGKQQGRKQGKQVQKWGAILTEMANTWFYIWIVGEKEKFGCKIH